MVHRNPDERYESSAAALRDIARDLQVETARDSYRRIMRTTESQEKFFRTFYVRFLTAYPGMRKLFRDLPPLEDSAANSEGWKRQFQKLKEAVLLLVVFSALREDQQEPNIRHRTIEHYEEKWRRDSAGFAATSTR